MSRPLNPQQTVAGRLVSGKVVYVSTRSRVLALRVYGDLAVGYRAVDGRIVQQRGEISESLSAAIGAACKVQENRRNAGLNCAKKSNWLKRSR